MYRLQNNLSCRPKPQSKSDLALVPWFRQKRLFHILLALMRCKHVSCLYENVRCSNNAERDIET